MVLRWRKRKGELVGRLPVVLELETDKNIHAQASGVVSGRAMVSTRPLLCAISPPPVQHAASDKAALRRCPCLLCAAKAASISTWDAHGPHVHLTQRIRAAHKVQASGAMVTTIGQVGISRALAFRDWLAIAGPASG